MQLFISIDAIDVARRITRLSVANEVAALRKLNQNIDLSRKIWNSWALRHDGLIISEQGPTVRLQIGAEVVDELEALRQQYSHSLDSPIAVGLGTELHQADRALQAAVKMGGGILPYSDYVEEVLSEKPKDDLLVPMSKADVAMNPGARSGAHQPARPTVDKPVASQGDHSATEAALEAYESSDRPAPMEGTHAAEDFEDQLHGHAKAQDEEDRRQQVASSQDYDSARQKVVQALKLLRDQAPVMEQIKAQAPDAYQAMMGLSEAVVHLSRMLRGAGSQQGAAIQKSEQDLEPLVKMAVLDPKLGYKIVVDPKPMPGTALVQAHAPNGEHVGTAEFWHKDDDHIVPEQVWVHADHRRQGIASAMYREIERNTGKRILPSSNQSHEGALLWEGNEENPQFGKDEPALDKALPLPESDGAASKHPLQLPVGAQKGARFKVRHGDGKEGWIQAEAGKIMSQDGHPISSRNPHGR